MDEMNFTIFSLIYSVRLKVKSIFFSKHVGYRYFEYMRIMSNKLKAKSDFSKHSRFTYAFI